MPGPAAERPPIPQEMVRNMIGNFGSQAVKPIATINAAAERPPANTKDTTLKTTNFTKFLGALK